MFFDERSFELKRLSQNFRKPMFYEQRNSCQVKGFSVRKNEADTRDDENDPVLCQEVLSSIFVERLWKICMERHFMRKFVRVIANLYSDRKVDRIARVAIFFDIQTLNIIYLSTVHHIIHLKLTSCCMLSIKIFMLPPETVGHI